MNVLELMSPAQSLRQRDIDHGEIDPDKLLPADFYPVIDNAGRVLGVIPASLLRLVHERDIRWTCCLDRHFTCVPPEQNVDDLLGATCSLVVQNTIGEVLGVVPVERLLFGLRATFEELRLRFFTIIDSAQNGIVVVDSQGTITIANKSAAELLNIDHGAIVGQKIGDLVPNTMMNLVLENKMPMLGQKLLTKHAVLIANYSPMFLNGDLCGAVSIFQDISTLEGIYTELDQVKALLKELDAVIESSYDGLSIVDGGGVVLRVNKAYQAMTGVTSEEIVGKKMRHMVRKGVYDQSVSKLVMESRKPVTINQSINGRQFLVTGNPLFDEQGSVYRVVTNLRDTTELARLQNELEHSREKTQRYKTELKRLRDQHLDEDDGIVFRSRSMEQVLLVANKVADVDSGVLITGESGTGKDLIAKLIHKRGKGSTRPFIKINCAALPEHLLESELFGYEAGSFTGAKSGGKPGMFELAQGGTLFLDEIGDMPQFLQVKLLRALQDKEIMRLGGVKTIRVDVRIIAATNRNLEDMLRKGTFREDLYYRLMVVPIHLPPLRDRKRGHPRPDQVFSGQI